MKKLLIIDDQAGIRFLLAEIFKQAGVETVVAATGKEALGILDTIQPGCILLDMKMPGMNGVEVLREIRKRMPEAVVMMMTAYSEIELTEEAKTLGLAHYFTKPFDVFEVRDIVVKRLQLQDV